MSGSLLRWLRRHLGLGAASNGIRSFVPRVRFEDLPLSEVQMTKLEALATEGRSSGGTLSLFTGGNRTRKGHAAEALAQRLGRDLIRVDLPAVASRYAGDTRAALEAAFKAAEQSGGVLLIDEADALFGKRSEVRDSHDRYANLEVAYLLERMEDFRGTAILATNMKQTLDPAFMRRLRHSIDFPPPSS